MLTNCEYNKTKLLHALSCCSWFIEKHCKGDAQNAGDQEHLSHLEQLKAELDKHIDQLHKSLCK